MTNNKWFYSGGVDQHAFHGSAAESDDAFYIIAQGDGRDPYVVKYDKVNETWSSAVKIADTWLPSDGHGAPGLTRDGDGYLHAFFGCHDTKIQYYRSVNPDDITSWSERTTLSLGPRLGTYPFPFYVSESDTLFLFYRTGSPTSSLAERYDMQIISSTDNGTSWSTATKLFENVGATENLTYFTDRHHWLERISGTCYLNLTFVYHNYSPLNFRNDFFFARYNTSDSCIYNISGTNIGQGVTTTSAHQYLKVLDTSDRRCYMGCFTRRDGTGTPMCIINYEYQTLSYRFVSLEWDGTTWSNMRVLTTSNEVTTPTVVAYPKGDKTVAYMCTQSAGGDLDMWEYDWDDKIWTHGETVFKKTDCPNTSNGWRVLIGEPTTTPLFVFQEVGATPYVFAAGIIDENDVPRYLMDKYTKKMYFHARASPPIYPTARPEIEIDEGLYLGDFLGGLSGAGLTTSAEDLEHIFSMSTTYSGEIVHDDFDTDTPESIFPLLLLDDIPSGSPVWYENLLMEYGQTHQGWHKAFITPPLKTNFTFSERVGINIYTDQQYHVEGTVTGAGDEYTGHSYPRFRIYVWKSSSEFGRTLLDEVSTVSSPTKSDTIVHTTTGFLENVPLETSYTASAGDRIVVEVLTVDQPEYLLSVEPPGTIHFASHVFGIAGSDSSGDARSYIEFVTDGYSPSFSKYVDTARTLEYNLSNGYTSSNVFDWGINGVLTKELTSSYNIRKSLDDIFSLETSTTLAGRCSLKISGDTSIAIAGDGMYDYYTSTLFYRNRYQEKRASLNKFVTIDDFENYYTKSDIYDSWLLETTGEIPRGALAKRVFATPRDFSDYNVISFYSKANGNTLFGVYMKDSSENISPITWIPISRRPGRYEFSYDVHSIYKASVTSVNFIFPYSDTIWLDDIVLLDMREDSVEKNWMPINLVDLETQKQAKINTIKIPFKRGEVVQHHGEHSARGSFVVKSLDGRDVNFLSECEQDGIPLYLRAKNAGIPIWILSHDAVFRYYSERGLKTDIQVQFAEIYNSEY